MSNGQLRRAPRRRRTALFASVAGIAVAAVTALAILPAGATAGPGSAIPAAAIPALRTNMFRLARFKTNMFRLARFNGDAHPASIRAVFTTQAKALRTATPGDLIPGSAGRLVYLVVMTGNFEDTHASVPPGARIPAGRYLAVTINPATFDVMDLGIGNHRPPVPLRSYGPVSDLTRQQG